MPPAQQREQNKELEQHKRETLHALIGEQVIHLLGKPAGPHRVQVRKLWESFYRVNVLVGVDASSLRITNSFFLKVDGEGKIAESMPNIVKQKPA